MLEESLRRVHYLFRQWLTFLELDELVEMYDNMSGEYEDLSPRNRFFLEQLVDDILDGIDPLIEQSLINSERYSTLPLEIKTLFERDVNSVFNVNKVIRDAFACRETMKDLIECTNHINFIDQKCVQCEIQKIIRNNRGLIYKQS